MKQTRFFTIPNVLSLFRLLASPLLLWMEPLSAGFMTLYLFLGLSDMLDGFLARRWLSFAGR